MTDDTLPHATAPRFFHDWIIPRVVPPLRDDLQVLLFGGPGTGKSYIARYIDKHGDLGTAALWVNGKDFEQDPQSVEEALQKARATDFAGPVFIDDLDILYREEKTRDAVTNLLLTKKNLLVTSSLPPNLNVPADARLFNDAVLSRDLVDRWSKLVQRPELVTIEPWAKGWQREIVNAIRAIVANDNATSDDEVSGWWTIVVHLTGGHPTMLAEALAEIGRTVEVERARDAMPESDGRPWRQEYARIEQHLHGNALRRIRHAWNWLQENFPEPAEKLKHVASRKLDEKDITPQEQGILANSALAHRGNMEGLVVSGEVIRQYIGGTDAPPQPFIDVQEDAGGTTGRILINVADTSSAVPVGETAWKIVQALSHAGGEPVSIDELKTSLNLTQGAIRSSLQRLREDISKLHLDGVIQNERGTGYRFGSFPIVQQKRKNT
jgi:biotin operon repressor